VLSPDTGIDAVLGRDLMGKVSVVFSALASPWRSSSRFWHAAFTP
jgi:hypothetical protein